jgi:drug/metabolite transporter (DMT)-like permease
MSPAQTVILLSAGAGAAIGQFGVTAAYRFAPPRQIAVYDYTNIIFTTALGLIIFGQVPDPVAILGFIAIIAAAALTNGKDR